MGDEIVCVWVCGCAPCAQSVGALMSEGKIAIMLSYLGELCPVAPDPKTTGDTVEPCVQMDPWRAAAALFPHKVGCRAHPIPGMPH